MLKDGGASSIWLARTVIDGVIDVGTGSIEKGEVGRWRSPFPQGLGLESQWIIKGLRHLINDERVFVGLPGFEEGQGELHGLSCDGSRTQTTFGEGPLGLGLIAWPVGQGHVLGAFGLNPDQHFALGLVSEHGAGNKLSLGRHQSGQRDQHKDESEGPTHLHGRRLQVLSVKSKAAKVTLRSTSIRHYGDSQLAIVPMPNTVVPLWSISAPTTSQVQAFLDEQKDQKLSYEEIQQTRGAPPSGYSYDDNHVQLGVGDALFAKACEALKGWRMFPSSWTKITVEREGAVFEGLNVVMQARALGLWWMNACRVVYVVDDFEPVRRYGFAYGTLPAHVEQGEELFTIEQWADGTVWYRVQAFSRPHYWPVKVGRPLARVLQRRFVRDSQSAMVALFKEQV